MSLRTSLPGLRSNITIQRVYFLMVIHTLTSTIPIHTTNMATTINTKGRTTTLLPSHSSSMENVIAVPKGCLHSSSCTIPKLTDDTEAFRAT